MTKLRTISDVPAWGLCVGCGACRSACERNAVRLTVDDSAGILPVFDEEACDGCTDCLEFCPGARLNSLPVSPDKEKGSTVRIGQSLGIWEGHSTDPSIRFRASSGGVLTALALYCLEKEKMALVLHTGMDPEKPWRNRTIVSRTRDELVSAAGSRYTASSPCDSLDRIEAADSPCVFIGKPCDAAAVTALRKKRPVLDRNLGAVLTFFCAGTPFPKATLDLLAAMGCAPESATGIRYRGEGWPGRFTVRGVDGQIGRPLTYKESWGFLAGRSRPLRCHICPDGLGEIADVSSGDAWHRRGNGDNPGESIAIARSERGRDLLRSAKAAGYLELVPSGAGEVIAAQGMVSRRSLVFGRLAAMRMAGMPVPRYEGFPLFEAWLRYTGVGEKVRSIGGTLKRIASRGLWRRGREAR